MAATAQSGRVVKWRAGVVVVVVVVVSSRGRDGAAASPEVHRQAARPGQPKASSRFQSPNAAAGGGDVVLIANVRVGSGVECKMVD